MINKNKKSFIFLSLVFTLLACSFGLLINCFSTNAQQVYAVPPDDGGEVNIDVDGEIDIGDFLENDGHGNNNEQIVNAQNNQVANANNAGANAAANPANKGKYDNATKTAMVNYGVKAASSLNDMIYDAVTKDGAVDWLKYSVNIIKSGAALAATAYFGSPAAGAAVDGAFDMILKWCHIGETSQSELQMMEARLNDQFDKISREIDDVKRQIAELSTKLTEEIDRVLNKIDESFEAYYAKTQVTDFIYSTSGNFSYNILKNYIYGFEKGNSFGDLATSVTKNASDEEIERTYKNLYKALMGARSNGASYLDMFTEYYIGSNTRQSIGHYYYDYVSSNQSYITDNASLVSLDFASQVYYDYMTMINFIRFISSYQMSQIFLQNSDMTGQARCEAKYYYGEGQDDYLTINEIQNTLNRLDTLQEAAYRQMLKDVEYIVGLGSSYLVKEQDGRQRYVTKNDTNANVFGNVLSGETIYLNQLIVPYCNQFGLDSTLFRYEFYEVVNSNKQYLEEDLTKGYYTIKTYNNFQASLVYKDPVYGDIALYTINFRLYDDSTYLGGKGTIDDPYVIGTTRQFKLIYNETKNDKCYMLVKDLDFGNDKLDPLYSDINQYNGTFDGGGHVIKNVKINVASKDTASIFGVIGGSGVVEYLEFDKISVYEYKTNDDAKKIVAGTIAAVNNGRIISCYVSNSSVEAGRKATETNTEVINKAISMYVGGIVGENYGEVSYCKIESTTVKGSAIRYYSANEDSNNRNSVYGGGLVGLNGGLLKNSYAAASVQIIVKAESYMYAGLSIRYPYINVWAGGITGYATSLKNIKEVFSEVTAISATYDYKNEHALGGSKDNHIESKPHVWVPNQKENDLTSIKAANKNTYQIRTDKKKLEYSFSTEKCTDPEFAEYSKDLVYDGRDRYFVIDNLDVKLVTTTESGSTFQRKVNYTVVGVYGFDSKNTSTTEHALRAITIKIYDVDNNTIYTIENGYYAKKNKVYKIEVPSDYTKTFMQNQEVTLFDVLRTNDLEGEYYNGTKTNVFADATFELDTTQTGSVKGYIRYDNIVEELDFVIKCAEQYDQQKVVVTEYNLSDDGTYVTVYGYKEEWCSICGEKRISYIAKEFATTIVGEREATCSEYGYTGDICVLASETDGILVEDLVVKNGERTALKPHNFDYPRETLASYHDSHGHFCINCGFVEEHMYKTSEIDDKVVCTCVKCEYTTTLDVNSREEIEKLPRVVVQNAYVVPATEQVTVFVDLHANSGITAANFTVNFDSQLTLVSYKLGNILNGRSSIDSFRLYDDHLNVSVAQSGTDYKSDGTILALTFQLPRVKIPADSFYIQVTNKDNKDKFTDQKGNKTDFIAYAGRIIVVSRLPGDVNDDEVLDLVDAVILSNYTVLDSREREEFIARMQQDNQWFDINYGDVNLDGSIDISDIVQILRYTTGGYETTLVSNIFQIVLNHNYQDENGQNVEEDFFVRYDNGTGKFGDIRPLPELQREGYKFVGWFTEYFGKGTQVTNDTLVFYNTNQYRQMLYAYFVPNTITFDANGGVGEKPTLDYQSNFSLSNTYGYNEKYFTKQSQVVFNESGIGTNTSRILTHQLLGWALTPNGEVVYAENDVIDLSKSGYDGVGKLVLYAVWSQEILEPNKPVVEGYTFLNWTASTGEEWDGESQFVITKDTTFYAQWRKNTFSIIYKGNGGKTSSNEIEYTELVTRSVTNYSIPLAENTFSKQGYKFLGWSLDPNATQPTYTDKQVLNQSQTNMMFNYVDNLGYAWLFAVWEGNQYTVVFEKNSTEATGTMDNLVVHCGERYNLPLCTYSGVTNKHFVGWALYPTTAVIYEDGQEVFDLSTTENSTIHLYAVWEYDVYNVIYTMSGYVITVDKVTYNSPYTFRTDFEDILPNYSIVAYYNTYYTKGYQMTNWTLTSDVNVAVELVYDNTKEFYNCRYFHAIKTDNGDCDIKMYTIPKNTKRIIIPHYIKLDDGNIYPVVYIMNKAFYSVTNIQSVETIVLPNTIKEIGRQAFLRVKAKEIYMTNSVTLIKEEAFSGITTLETFVLSHNAEIKNNTFTSTVIQNLLYTGPYSTWSGSSARSVLTRLEVFTNFYYYDPNNYHGTSCWNYNNGVITLY